MNLRKSAARAIPVIMMLVLCLVLFYACKPDIQLIQFVDDKIEMNVGDNISPDISILPTDAELDGIELVSDNKNIIVVRGTQITAVAEGTAIIHAEYNGEVFDYCTVSVRAVSPERLFFPFESMELGIGRESDNLAQLLPENVTNKNISYESSDPGIVQISQGAIIAVSEGTATITASHEYGLTAECTISVLPVPLEKMELVGVSSLEIDSESKLSVLFTPYDVTDKNVTWTSSKPSIISIDEGLISANAIGTATITVKHDSGIVLTKEIEVLPVFARKISIKSSISLYETESTMLEATITPSDTTDKNLTWTSDNPSIAKVQNGLITGVSPGITVIRVTTSNGIESTSTVTVKSSVKAMTVTISSSCLNYNHVGNEWGAEFLVNGRSVSSGDVVSVELGRTLSVKTTIVEYDKYNDVGIGRYSETMPRDFFENGFYLTQTIHVMEGNGAYAGNVAIWTVTYTFEG